MADPVIPQRTAIRGIVPGTYDPERRPGSSGQRYFSDIEYVSNVEDPNAQRAANLAAQARRNEQAAGLQALNLSNLARQERPATFLPPAETSAGIATVTSNQTTGSQRFYDLLQQLTQGSRLQPYGTGTTETAVARYTPLTEISEDQRFDVFDQYLADPNSVDIIKALNIDPNDPRAVSTIMGDLFSYQNPVAGYTGRRAQRMAQGGLATLAQGGNIQGPGQQYLGGRGFYLGGSTDGMADQIPATIDNTQPAALSDGEFVIPADVVSHLGNGNSDAGAKQLYGMMDRIRKARTGTTQQGKQINPNKFLA